MERKADDPERLELRFRLGMAEGDVRAVDLEAMTARIDGVGHPDAGAKVGEIAAGDDREADLRSPGDGAKMIADSGREPCLRWLSNDRAQRAVVVRYHQDTPAIGEPVPHPREDPVAVAHELDSTGNPVAVRSTPSRARHAPSMNAGDTRAPLIAGPYP